MSSMDEIRQTFFQECEEGLSDLEAGLLRMDAGETDGETINAVFRAVHSIKGGAGAFGLDALVRFAHAFESTLDDIRSDRLLPEPPVVTALLRANDVLADLVAAARDVSEVDEGRVTLVTADLHALTGTVEGSPVANEAEEDWDFLPVPIDVVSSVPDDPALALTPADDLRTWTVRFRPAATLYANGNDPLLLLRELGRLGQTDVVLDTDTLPSLAGLDPEASYLAWTVTLLSNASRQAVADVFEFVDGDCDLSITDGKDEAAAPAPEVDLAALIAAARAETDVSAPSPVVSGTPAPAPTPGLSPAPPTPAAVPVAAHPPSAPASASALLSSAPLSTAAAPPSIRVELDRVDRLINLVGELVINGAMLNQRMAEVGMVRGSAASVALDELDHLTRDIQDSVMAIRAQPVRGVFGRMPRLVRETAALVGKPVRLVTEGEGTEVDKTVIERLTDPLTHMIRNSIDHGIELPDMRAAAGKPAEGVVRLTARHRSGRIVIEVADDGAGIDRPRVRQIAVNRGLIDPDAVLSDEETDNLIFAAGFSTAATVSDISGRGVGMDVVRRSIQGLGGRISISSEPGRGSTFTLSLPLTLAVLDGMVVTAMGQTLVVPLTAIMETFKPRSQEIHPLAGGRVVNVRDAFLPLVEVGTALGYERTAAPESDGVALLVETENGARAALLVDAIGGQRQVVIKSLEANYRRVPGIAAATILGDGRVALILDVDAVVANCRCPDLPLGDDRATPVLPRPLALAG